MSYLHMGDSPPLKRMKQTFRQVSDDDDSPASGGDKKKKVKGKGGSSCHQCKSRRNFTALTYCTSNLDKKNKKCRKKFCGHCLKKFYKETPQGIPDRTCWRCPSCRKICCCAACRRRKNREAGNGYVAPPSNPKPPKPKKVSAPRVKNTEATERRKQQRPSPAKVYHSPHLVHSQQDYREPQQMDYTPMSEYPRSSQYQSQQQFQPHDSYNQRHQQSYLQQSNNPYQLHNGFPQSQRLPPTPQYHSQTPEYESMMNSNRFDSLYKTTFSPLIMPASDMSSPVATPLQMPSSFGDFPGMPLHDLNDGGRVARSQYPSLLHQEIEKQAKQASQDKNNSQFAHLYGVAQTPEVRNRIHQILSRTDISQDQKVEFIAQLLRVYERNAQYPQGLGYNSSNLQQHH